MSRKDSDLYGQDFCMHPNMSDAYRHYPGYKEEVARLIDKFGPKGKYMITSPFQDAALEDRQMAEQDERYWSTPEEVDQVYIDNMRALAVKYLAEHPEETKPDTADHPYYDPAKKKHWWDGI